MQGRAHSTRLGRSPSAKHDFAKFLAAGVIPAPARVAGGARVVGGFIFVVTGAADWSGASPLFILRVAVVGLKIGRTAAL